MLKKKGLNPNKAQSPLKNLDVDMQYRLSAELANKFKIKREQLANERNDKAKKEQAPIPHKRKNSMDFIPQQGNRKGQTKQRLFQFEESIQDNGTKLPMNNSRFHTSFKKDVTASAHMTEKTLDQRIHKDDETKRDNHTATDVEFLHTPIINEQNKGSDGRVEQEEFSKDKCDVEEEIDIDCSTKDMS
ncbi:hypothetical protein EJD97_022675 [Solanum chilense]|uniref:Uncharacterized protein n=1 Tax=Solanum chilense TaxID=4083 RepID=A0A6N2AVT9_SOLCI|nr:hypothetical protein EJD97_022675 [Solanum chilense]